MSTALIFKEGNFSTIQCDSLEKPNGLLTKGASFKYKFDNDIIIRFREGSVQYNKPTKVLFEFKGVTFIVEDGLSLVNTANLMNKYSKMNTLQVTDLFNNALSENKTQLESDVDNLKNEKLSLEKEIANLKRAVKLKAELKEVLSQL